MSVVKEWSYDGNGQGIEDYANHIISYSKSLIRIFELLNDPEEDKDSWLDVGRQLSQSIWEYGKQIDNIIAAELAEQSL